VPESPNPVAQTLQERFGPPPSTAIVLGSGLGGLVDALQNAERASYGELGLPPTGVAGHAGSLAVGTLGESRVALLCGRVHSYEGRPMEEIVAAVRSVALWGVKRFVLTNAVGGVDPGLKTGSLVLVEDHLNLMGQNPLIGPNHDDLGPRFPDMSRVYDPDLREDARQAAEQLGVVLGTGVYAAVRGPSYETPAEVRMFAALGASTVGMSVVPEAIALAHMSVPTLAISMVSNPAAGLGLTPLRHEDVTEAAARAGSQLARLIGGLLSKWD